jgi:hypothetical protein
MNETERDSNVARQLTPPSHGRRLNEPRNISPSRMDDKRTNFHTVRLLAAASSAHPTKYGQNERAGIQDGAIFWINSGPPWKCSGANIASGTAMTTGVQGGELVPTASRADFFSKYKNSGNKIDKPGKRHPGIC